MPRRLRDPGQFGPFENVLRQKFSRIVRVARERRVENLAVSGEWCGRLHLGRRCAATNYCIDSQSKL
jgi:hypothetical protein